MLLLILLYVVIQSGVSLSDVASFAGAVSPFVAIGIAVGTVRHGAKRDHERWKLDRRTDAYEAVIVASNRLLGETSQLVNVAIGAARVRQAAGLAGQVPNADTQAVGRQMDEVHADLRSATDRWKLAMTDYTSADSRLGMHGSKAMLGHSVELVKFWTQEVPALVFGHTIQDHWIQDDLGMKAVDLQQAFADAARKDVNP